MSNRVIKCFYFVVLFLTLTVAASAATSQSTSEGSREEIRVVVVAMFEEGEVRGDHPGELQFWVERLALDRQLVFPAGERDIYLNDEGVLAILTGAGISNATASIMALGLDSRFDLTKAYWLIAGIAGGDPADLSLGSAAWARHVVDGDLLYEIDSREIPESWPYGLIPLGSDEPTLEFGDKKRRTLGTSIFNLNSELAEWAYSLTEKLTLQDSPAMAAARRLYVNYPQAQKPPFVVMGDTLSASTFWHGRELNRWANDWVRLYAGKQANFMTSNMEDSGSLTSLQRLDNAGLVDIDRVMVLRTVSNYTIPPAGKTASWSRTAPYPDKGLPAKDAAFVVGNTVVQAILKSWSKYRDTTPGNYEQRN